MASNISIPLVIPTIMPVREGVSTDSLKFHPRPAMPDPSMSCGRATPQTALRPFGGRPAAVFFPLGYPTPYGPAIQRFPSFQFPIDTRGEVGPEARHARPGDDEALGVVEA
jgi:hypothetical protein